MGKTILEQSKTTTKGEILFTMTTLPEPTLQDLKDYETFHQSPKYIVKYRETLMTEDPNHRIKKIKHYGFFVSKKEAQDHFSNLPTYYKWKTETYAREFIDILSLEEFKQHRHKKWFKRKVNNNDRRK
jgi:hypothetical protein